MRLSLQEQQTISGAMHKHFGRNATVLLFGSRTDDNAKGGDIDLYVEPENHTTAQALKARSEALWDMQCKLGEQKIDIVMALQEGDPLAIYDEAKRTGIPL